VADYFIVSILLIFLLVILMLLLHNTWHYGIKQGRFKSSLLMLSFYLASFFWFICVTLTVCFFAGLVPSVMELSELPADIEASGINVDQICSYTVEQTKCFYDRYP
jgi:hypothetical protein